MDQGRSIPIHPGPNRSLPDVSEALAWRGWSDGVDEARRRRVPILALAEPRWTNSAQRLGLAFTMEDDLRQVLAESFVPILVDPAQRPDLAAQWRWASIALTGTSGPPLLVLLTHDGLPFLSYCTMWPEGRRPHPSLASLAHAVADAYARDPDAFVEEARTLQALVERDAAPAYRSAPDLWRALSAETDETHGGLRESPKHPHPQLLWLLLELGEEGEAPDAGEFVRMTLRHMTKGGIYDQLAEGFHRCARDDRWVVPHFEKPLPLNAQLAALYAKAARVFGEEGFLKVADDLAAFCSAGLRDGVDALGSDSHYYTWTPREVLDHLDPAFVQAVGFHYHLTPHPSRHVLYRALEPEAMDRYSHEAPEALRRRIEEGRRQLLMARSRRPPPETVRLGIPSWPAQSLRWLFGAAEQGCAVPIGELEGHLERLTVNRFRDGLGYPRAGDGSNAPEAWLEDQASLLAAMLACSRATNPELWLERARGLADVVLDQYEHEGGWLDQPGGRGDPQPSWAVTDDVLPSAIAAVTDALDELGRLLGDASYSHRARRAAVHHLPGANHCGHWAGAMWRAWFGINRESS